MADWALSEKAVLDLQEIALFTGENWGSAQSDAYLEAIYEAIDRIAEYPAISALAGTSFSPTRVSCLCASIESTTWPTASAF